MGGSGQFLQNEDGLHGKVEPIQYIHCCLFIEVKNIEIITAIKPMVTSQPSAGKSVTASKVF